MRLALNQLILAGPPSLAEQLRIAHEAGYEGLDVSLADVEGLADVSELSSRSGVQASCWMLPTDWRASEEIFLNELAELPGWCRMAQTIDCPRCMTWLNPTISEDPVEYRAFVVERFKRVADLLGEHGIRLGIEWLGPWHFRQDGRNIFIYTMPETLALVDDIGRPNVGLLVDSWHWFMAGDTLADLEALRPEQIVHVHFVDAPDRPYEEQRDGEREVPGEGIIDLVSFVRTLNQIGYSDFGSVEIFGQELPKLPPLEAAQKVKASCDAVLAKAAE